MSTRRMKIRVKGPDGRWWHLAAWPDDGRTQADVLCPHGVAVDVINNNRYDGKPGRQVSANDLRLWIAAYADVTLENVCRYGH